MARIGIISKSYINSIVLVLGEIFDNDFKTSKVLFQLHKDLSYLYPFTLIVKNGNIIYNKKDFNSYREKYKITSILKINKKINDSKIIFHSPILVNLDNMENLFSFNSIPYTLNNIKPIIGIMLPIYNSIDRGNVLEQILKSFPMMIILNGGTHIDNKNSTCILSYRYLRKKGFPKKQLIKASYTSNIFDSIDIIDIACGKQNIIIGCEYSVMISLKNKIKDRKVFYQCPL